MALLQPARNEAQFSDKEKAAIGQAMKQAKSYANSNNIRASSQNQSALVVGSMKNEQKRDIMLYKKCDYTGKYLDSREPPETIKADDSGVFVHQGDYSKAEGSKGAFIYCHIDTFLGPLGYVLAWDNPDKASDPKKVYVTAGPRELILKMKWDEIEHNLDASTNESRFPIVGPALACAEIKDEGDKLALLGASFYGLEPPSPA